MSRHVQHSHPRKADGTRKKRTLHYNLPDDQGISKRVCRIMFLNTLGVSEHQVRTALSKISYDGVMESENVVV